MSIKPLFFTKYLKINTIIKAIKQKTMLLKIKFG